MISQNIFGVVKVDCPNINSLWRQTFEHRRFIENSPDCVILEGIIYDDTKISMIVMKISNLM